MSKLKPCPFCGARAARVVPAKVNRFTAAYAVACPCGAIGPSGITELAAHDAWTDRGMELSTPRQTIPPITVSKEEMDLAKMRRHPPPRPFVVEASAPDLAARLETALGLLDELALCLEADQGNYNREITSTMTRARAFLATVDADTK